MAYAYFYYFQSVSVNITTTENVISLPFMKGLRRFSYPSSICDSILVISLKKYREKIISNVKEMYKLKELCKR